MKWPWIKAPKRSMDVVDVYVKEGRFGYCARVITGEGLTFYGALNGFWCCEEEARPCDKWEVERLNAVTYCAVKAGQLTGEPESGEA